MRVSRIPWLCLMALFLFSWDIPQARAGIHTAPIVVQGLRISNAIRFPVANYRLFRTGKNGEAVSIPFQIDEFNEWGDYILDQGPNPNQKESNGIFDLQDELAFMGDDVGPIQRPTSWPEGKPAIIFEIKFKNQRLGAPQPQDGAVYLGVYFRSPPPLVARKYAIFDPVRGRITTSRYQYDFDKQNYLILNNVDMLNANLVTGEQKNTPMIDSSTFYLKADMKYFLTLTANHRSINSKLDAYKAGPVRTITRVTFFYSIMKLNFEVGMYTEISFFSNAVYTPTIIYNPINGKDSLNRGSGFYYGFALFDNPDNFQINTNMPRYKAQKGLLDFFGNKPKAESKYWLNVLGKDVMFYAEIEPSEKMRKDDNIPYFYKKSVPAKALSHIDNNQVNAIEKSPVNVALYFDLTKFDKGEHNMSFKLFFDNKRDEVALDHFRRLSDWNFEITRL